MESAWLLIIIFITLWVFYELSLIWEGLMFWVMDKWFAWQESREESEEGEDNG